MNMDFMPDILNYNLKVLFIGYNPGLRSAEVGHHYAGKSNSFWKLLFESGLTPYKLEPAEDRELLGLGFGSTNIVSRPSRSAAELKTQEFREGAAALRNIMEQYRPRVACYVGIGVYKIFSGKRDAAHGVQLESMVEGIIDYVCPSPSGLNRMPYREQLDHFRGLKTLLQGMGVG